ncbi:MAG: D-alanyl-D-alanine carboxypeptidase family protein [Patescibacteria group bacterium]
MELDSKGALTKRLLLVCFLALVGLGVIGATVYELYLLNKKNAELVQNLNQLRTEQAATARSLKDTISILDQNLSLTKSEQDKLRGVLDSEQERARTQAAQLESISGSVGTLEKLTYTDKELLQKYSKIYFLNENYIPSKLNKIPSQYVYQTKEDLQLHTSILPHLIALLEGNTNTDFDLRVISAYRSFGTQADLKSSYSVTYGAGSANQFSADQGYSEHQLGTTVDFTTVRTGADFSSFKETYDYKWLLENAYKYGFTLSYLESNTYYQFEPWHWRFVGIKLATHLHDERKHFYDLDQREIDTYLVSIFD